MSRFYTLLFGLALLISVISTVAARHPSDGQSWLAIAAKLDGGYYVRNSPYPGGLFAINTTDHTDMTYHATINGFEAPASFSPDGQWIVFHSSNETERSIYKVRVDGSARQRLTSSDYLDGFPSWSPDGQWIAYISIRDGKPKLYRMRPDGSQKRLIAEGVHAGTLPSWSPDSRWLAVVLLRDNNWDVYRVRMDGSARERLTHHAEVDGLPSWSPDGHFIAYLSRQSDRWGLSIVTPDGKHRAKLNIDFEPVERPFTWSPDGQWLAFEAKEGDIVRVRRDGTHVQKLTDTAEHDLYPSWSPDGEWIAFVTVSNMGTNSLYKMRPDGTDRQLILQDYAAYRPLWSPKINLPLETGRLITLSLTLILSATVVILAIWRKRLKSEVVC